MATQTAPDEPLSRSDTANIQLDAADQVNVVLLAGVVAPQGWASADGTVDFAALRSWFAERLADDPYRLRRFSQRVSDSAAAPYWQHCSPDLSWHVRAAQPHTEATGLAELCAQLMTSPLPMDRPLWEVLVVSTPQTCPPHIVLRMHHCVADGIGGVQLVQRLLGAAADDADRPGSAPQRRPSREHRGLSLRRIAALLQPATGPNPLLGRIGQHRQVGFAEVELSAFSRGSHHLGGTVNDGLLAVVAAGLAQTLAEPGSRRPRRIRAGVPVALPRSAGSGNATGVMIVDLTTSSIDPRTLVAEVAAQTRQAKAAARSQGTYELTRSHWGTWLFALLARHQRFASLFITNVPGPTQPLALAGAPLRLVWPVTPLQGNVRVSVSAMSYANRFTCAVHADEAALSAKTLSQAIQDGLDRIAASPSAS